MAKKKEAETAEVKAEESKPVTKADKAKKVKELTAAMEKIAKAKGKKKPEKED